MTITPHQHPVSRDSSQYGTPISTRTRVVLVVLAVLMLIGFGLASYLTPSKTGRGTHRQLGLPPCSILSLTNTPCPTCGMTTSFSHFVRGEWAAAVRANTSGFLLACGCLIFLPWSVASVVFGQFWLIRRMDLVITGLLPGWLIIVFLEWGWRNYLPL
ncbi:MAG: DUF2752 domain-containing protein [Planctomycetaceae bacterium]|jgi:hypothetical protein|nr:DUF2752 domain-containing protein [Planctomycetaceae bacterium]